MLPFCGTFFKFQLTTSRRGRRYLLSIFQLCFYISTHDLTKRSTQVMLSQSLRSAISTHDLTKRSTRGERKAHPNPSHFNSRPHEEVDRVIDLLEIGLNISTHDLTKRSTTPGREYPTSQENFNSRPHEEVDFMDGLIQAHSTISTHDLTKRSTAIFTQKVFLSKLLFVLIAYNIFILH